MDNKISIELKENLLNNNPELKYINNNNECIICSQFLKNSTDLVLLNKLCKCYDAVKICEDCFVSWLSYNNECLVCRQKLNKISYYPQQKIIDLNIELDEISEEDYPIDIRILRNANMFISLRTFRIWCFVNRCNILSYILVYGFMGFAFYNVKRFMDFQKYSNTTNMII